MKILIIRNMAQQISINTYNNQELGLARSLAREGHQCDIVFYSKKNRSKNDIIHEGNSTINIYWMRGLNIYYNAVFFKLLFSGQLNQYDIIQTHEYNQLMTVLLPYFTKKKTVIYHGPYKDISKKLLHKLFDFLFLRSIVKHYDYVIAKSYLATDYLADKGFRNIRIISVGLDDTSFQESVPYSQSVFCKYSNELEGMIKLLYIGKLEERRNIRFLLDIVYNMSHLNKNVKLLLIGDGTPEDKQKYFNYIKELGIDDYVLYIEKVKQTEIKHFYMNSDIFLLPTSTEIFGMVLLEALYFNCPVLTTLNGGSSVLLKDKYPEMILDELDVTAWVNRINLIVKNNYETNDYIKNNYSWNALSKEFIKVYEQAIANGGKYENTDGE